ncbi:MAG TPA: LytTR family DNA-binding domain-containing protein [Longimicrobiaceae bacterium]|nr:LytTR family DNA-binding domain-containing protein [Longimicrobiaceae bacterium]
MRITTLIVDDEPLARARIRGLLAQEKDFELVGEARDGAEAIEAVRELRPDLVFLDIQMPQVDGFGVVQAIGPANMPLTIFVTAFDEFALRAFEAHALDYLLKPFAVERFAGTLERVRQARGRELDTRLQERLEGLLESLGESSKYLERFVVRSGPKLRFVFPDEVDWMSADGNYVRLHSGGTSSLIRESMGKLETRLDPRKFVRIHRSTIVNVERIRELESVFQGEYLVVLQDGTRLSSSRAYRGRLESAMSIG